MEQTHSWVNYVVPVLMDSSISQPYYDHRTYCYGLGRFWRCDMPKWVIARCVVGTSRGIHREGRHSRSTLISFLSSGL